MNAIRELAEKDYPSVIGRIETFYALYEEAWSAEKKPQGFDVQDVRLGGLILRMKHLNKRLIGYLEGKETSLPELEEELLLPFGLKEVKGFAYNYYGVLVTANVT